MATKNINLALDERLLKRVDALVKNEMNSRSEYFRRLALADLERRKTLPSILDAANMKGESLVFKDEERAMAAMTPK